MNRDKQIPKFIAIEADRGTSKRKAEGQKDSGRWKKKKDDEDTDKEICLRLIETANNALAMLRHSEERARATNEVLENRIRRLEVFADLQHDFNDRQDSHNAKVARVLEILVGCKCKNTCSETDNRDQKVDLGGDVDATGGANMGGLITEENQTSTHLGHGGVRHPKSTKFGVIQSPPKISLKREDLDCREVDKPFDDGEGLIFMDGWTPAKQKYRNDGGGYDPFGPIQKKHFMRLRNIVNRDRGFKIGEKNSRSEFYIQLLLDTPRWPGDQYRWLTDEHMCRGMDLFRKRSMQTPTPYKSERIAFLDPLLCVLWCHKRAEYEKNPFLQLDSYLLEMFRGETPTYSATNKVWYRDVDVLYVAHFVAGNHWVAVEINLLTHCIYIYDSAVGVVTDTELFNSVRAYETLIAALVEELGPNEKPIDVKKFAIIRSSKTPVNHKSGDCGIYTLKFIECAALGVTFAGLEDKNIRFLRRKLAVDILTEVVEGSSIH